MNPTALLRGLRRSPRLSLAAIACIALGMAATAAVATLVDLTTFRVPPFPAAERFVRIWNAERGTDERDLLTFRDLADLRDRLTALDALEAAAPARLIWHRGGDIGRRVEGEAVSAGYLDLLGVQPYVGRMISAEEHARGDAVLLLSYATWGQEFGYDEDVLGQALRVSYQTRGDGAVYTVIGVLPPDFAGTTESDMPELEFWIPLRNYYDAEARQDRTLRGLLAIGRLAPGATLGEAQAQADALHAALAGELTDEHVFRVEAFGADWRSPFRTASAALGAAAHRYEAYLSLRQLPRRIVSSVVHVDGDPAAYVEPLKRVLARVAPSSAVDWVDPFDRFIAWLYRDSAFRLAVVAAFGLSALVLALVGLYAVLSQQVVRATGEIGIRKSLGATDGRIRRDVVRRGLRTVLAGLAAGLAGSVAFSRLLGNLLHGVGIYDPWAFASAAGLLLAAGLAACWLPARRAAAIEPMQALREP